MAFFGVYLRVLRALGADRPLAAGLALINLLLASLSFLEPVLFGAVIDTLTQGGEPQEVWRRTLELLALWGGVGATAIGLNMVLALYSDRMAHRNRLAAMQQFFEHVLALPLSFHGDTHSGRLLKVMLTGADNMFWLWLAFFREHLATFFGALILLPLTFFLNWRLSLLLIALVVLFAGLVVVVIRNTHRQQEAIETHHSALASSAGDALANIMVVQSFTRREAELAAFGSVVKRVIAAQFPVLTWWAIATVLSRFASTAAVLLIFVLGTALHLAGQARVGEIVAFMGFATLLIGRLEAALSFSATLFFKMPALADYFRVLEAPNTVPDRPGAVDPGRLNGEVTFDNVVFSYPGGPPVLDGVSFTVRRGQAIALVGHTGAGKSTAMALLQRLWDPANGSILVDGHDIRSLKIEALRRNIGVVFQEALLFNRSVLDNLRVGKPDATEAETEAATRAAEAHDFILRQPQGYATLVGERGATLSGGQRQRLSIARALLKDPPILILDEATSALDAATEARVQTALKRLMAGRTTFIIAHRLSTVREADEILVFNEGRVVERGTFDDLVSANGTFADLVRTQMGAHAHA